MISKKSGAYICQNKWFTEEDRQKYVFSFLFPVNHTFQKSDDSHFLWCNRQFDTYFFSPYFIWDHYILF